MRIEEIMRKKVVTVSTDTTIADAFSLLHYYRIRHLPVLAAGRLVGILSDRDLRGAHPSSLHKQDGDQEILQKSVSEIMVKQVITAHPLDFVMDAAKTVYDFRVGSLPVLEDDILVGLVTKSDILRCLTEIFGVNRASSHLEVIIEDHPDSLLQVSQVFRDAGVRICGLVMRPLADPTKKALSFRVQTIDTRPLIDLLERHGLRVLAPSKGGANP